ncbi:hypothetical protein ACP275_02G078400 [Erythranthe tilingii]
MRVTGFISDALGVVTICLVSGLFLLGLFCIIYSFYFRSRVRGQGLVQYSYFSGPLIIRITYIFLAVWWGVGEIIRLSLLRRKGRFLDTLTLQWQENICKCYIISNLGFAEPCMFLTLVFLLRASLQRSGTLSRKWNVKTIGFVLLYCFPVLVLQLVVILIGPKYKKEHNPKLPSYFISSSKTGDGIIAFCSYPLLSTIFLGIFATVLTAYLFCLGGRILHLVINKGLQKRVYRLFFCVSCFLPLRVLLLGLSVLTDQQGLAFDSISFLAFLSLLCCAGVGICMLVYLPIADSLSLRNLQRDVEARRVTVDEYDNDAVSLISNRSDLGRNLSGSFVELSLFNPSQH